MIKCEFMTVLSQWFTIISSRVRSIFQMLLMSWQAQPICFLGLIIVLLVQGIVPLATAWVAKMLFDLLGQSIIYHQITSVLTQKFIWLIVAQVGLTVINQIVNPLNTYLNAELGRKLSLKIKTNVYQKLNSFTGLSYFEDPRFHNTIQLVANGVQFSPLQSFTIVTTLLQNIIIVITFFAVLIGFNSLLIWMVLVVVIPQFFVKLRLGRQRFGMAFNNSPKERRASYYGQVLSWVAFAKEVRLFNLGDYFLKAFRDTTQEIQHTQRNQQKRELYWQLPLSILTSVITAGAFGIVVLQVLSKHLSIGDVALYTSAITSLQGSFLGIVTSLSQVNECVLFYSQYNNLLALPRTLSIPKSVQKVSPLTSGITLCDVSFRYSSQHPWVLHHINLFLPANKCLALVGLNGAGKTTLVKLLTRLYDPTEGKILWDGININEFDPLLLRQHIGTILQDFSRYDLTIQQNIGIGDVVQVENSKIIEQAAIQAGIHERILELPQGYQSFLGRWLADNNPGVDLSGGELQKIALARLFMRNADLLILDEPTASLDAKAEFDLYSQFQELMKGRTSLLITHRFSTVRMADIIAVIENGQITEYGGHDELLSLNGTYANLYSMQAAHYK